MSALIWRFTVNVKEKVHTDSLKCYICMSSEKNVRVSRECLIWREVSLSLHFRLLNRLQFHSDSIWGRSQDGCGMNGGQWRYTPQNPLSQDIIFCLVIWMLYSEGDAKKLHIAGCSIFLESLICFKKSFKMSMTSYTSHDQRYCFTAILQSLWCFQRMSMVLSRAVEKIYYIYNLYVAIE